MKRACAALALGAALSVAPTAAQATPAAPGPGPSAQARVGGPPVLAYYYIWFNATSWNRAKRDWPLVGRYSSDESSVMRAHVRAAKAAGITGFLVSWKDTPQLDERLAALVAVAREEQFTLGVVYQGLDVRREPLPVARVEHDMAAFAERWGSDPVFHVFDQPLMVWAGTWRFTAQEVAQVSHAVSSDLALLGSERDEKRWGELGGLLDGNAYYWSSQDPQKDLRGLQRLARMSVAVHATGDLWVAPATPGFDARLNAGSRVVDRRGGQTLRDTWAVALGSSPDAVGLISWNEFTENTHVEPSEAYGDSTLRTLASLTGTPGPQGDLDSSSSPEEGPSNAPRVLAVGGLMLALAGGVVRRAHRGDPHDGAPYPGASR